MSIRILLIMLFAISASGCVAPNFERLIPPPSDKVAVYIYRAELHDKGLGPQQRGASSLPTPRALVPHYQLNDEPAQRLHERASHVYYVEPGTLRLRYNRTQKKHKVFQLSTMAGEIVFIEFQMHREIRGGNIQYFPTLTFLQHTAKTEQRALAHLEKSRLKRFFASASTAPAAIRPIPGEPLPVPQKIPSEDTAEPQLVSASPTAKKPTPDAHFFPPNRYQWLEHSLRRSRISCKKPVEMTQFCDKQKLAQLSITVGDAQLRMASNADGSAVLLLSERSTGNALKQFLTFTLADNRNAEAVLESANQILNALHNNHIALRNRHAIVDSGDMVGYLLETNGDAGTFLQQHYRPTTTDRR